MDLPAVEDEKKLGFWCLQTEIQKIYQHLYSGMR